MCLSKIHVFTVLLFGQDYLCDLRSVCGPILVTLVDADITDIARSLIEKSQTSSESLYSEHAQLMQVTDSNPSMRGVKASGVCRCRHPPAGRGWGPGRPRLAEIDRELSQLRWARVSALQANDFEKTRQFDLPHDGYWSSIGPLCRMQMLVCACGSIGPLCRMQMLVCACGSIVCRMQMLVCACGSFFETLSDYNVLYVGYFFFFFFFFFVCLQIAMCHARINCWSLLLMISEVGILLSMLQNVSC